VATLNYNDLGDIQIEALRASIVDAFLRTEFEKLLQEPQQQATWKELAAEGNFDDRVLELLKASRRQGWTDKIVAAVKSERRNQRSVARLDVMLGLMAPVRPPGEASTFDDRDVLQRLITRKDNIVDVSKYNEVQARICRVDNDDKPVGTGFLIADNLILTNYHVVEAVKPSTARCRFDSRMLGTRAETSRDVLFASDWLVDQASYAPSDRKLNERPPTPDELDFAVVRLAEQPGLDLVHGVRRGSIKLTPIDRLVDGSLVQIIQHALGDPLAMSIGQVVGYSSDGLRLRYKADTVGGSSGSPVFAPDLSLVALHHAGDPNWDRPAAFNQGIPIDLILKRLQSKGALLPEGGASARIAAAGERPSQEATNGQTPPGTPVPAGAPAAVAASVVVLGEPRKAATASTVELRSALISELRNRNVPLEPVATHDQWQAAWNGSWGDGWRAKAPLQTTEAKEFFSRKPLFVRTLADSSLGLAKEHSDLVYQLHRRFGLEMDDTDNETAQLLQRCPRVLWRANGPPSDWEPTPPTYVNTSPIETFARYLADLLGLPDTTAETVIHCAHPADAAGHENEIRLAVEAGLVDAVGRNPEPDRRVFAPSKLRDVLRRLSRDGLEVLALNDMSVSQPATRDKAVEVFRGFDQDIDGSVGVRRNLIRIAVLVRTAEEFAGEVLFNSKARLQNWLLLRVPKGPDGRYDAVDPANVEFIRQQVVSIANGGRA
jgi:hypothetical protein